MALTVWELILAVQLQYFSFSRPVDCSKCNFAERLFNAFTTFEGSGKLHPSQALRTELDANNVSVAVTATTGLAAFAVAGQTVHRLPGLVSSRLTE